MLNKYIFFVCVHGDVYMKKYWIYIYLCIYTCVNTHDTMVRCIFAPVPLHALLHNNPNMFNFSPEQRKKSSACPKMFDLECSWHLRGLVFFRFPLFIYPSILSLFASILQVSMSPSFHIQPSIYLQDLHLTLYHSTYVAPSALSLLSLSLSLALSLSRSLALSLSLSLFKI